MKSRINQKIVSVKNVDSQIMNKKKILITNISLIPQICCIHNVHVQLCHYAPRPTPYMEKKGKKKTGPDRKQITACFKATFCPSLLFENQMYV